MKGMVLHCDADPADIGDLRSVVLPENHERFKDKCGSYGTVSHHRLVTSIRAMADYAFGENSILKESFGLSGGRVYPGARFFGLFRFDFGATDVDKALVDGIEVADDIEIADIITDEEQVADVVLNDSGFFNTMSVEDQNIYLNMENDQAKRNFMETKRNDAGSTDEMTSNIVTISDDTIYPALAIRNSYDRSMSVGVAVGYNVFICDNLCLSGEISFSRKHTINAFSDVVMTLWGLMQSMKTQHEFDLAWRDHARGVSVSDREGMEVLGVLAGNGFLNLQGGNKSQFATALKQWKDPQHEIFKDNSLWALENAITFAQAKSSIGKRLEQSNKTIREIRSLTEGNWNGRADDIARDAKKCDKATVLDLIDVIAESQKRHRAEAVEVLARVDNLENI